MDRIHQFRRAIRSTWQRFGGESFPLPRQHDSKKQEHYKRGIHVFEEERGLSRRSRRSKPGFLVTELTKNIKRIQQSQSRTRSRREAECEKLKPLEITLTCSWG